MLKHRTNWQTDGRTKLIPSECAVCDSRMSWNPALHQSGAGVRCHQWSLSLATVATTVESDWLNGCCHWESPFWLRFFSLTNIWQLSVLFSQQEKHFFTTRRFWSSTLEALICVANQKWVDVFFWPNWVGWCFFWLGFEQSLLIVWEVWQKWMHNMQICSCFHLFHQCNLHHAHCWSWIEPTISKQTLPANFVQMEKKEEIT